MNPFFYFSVRVSNITSSPEQDGSKTLQYINDERVPLLPLLNFSSEYDGDRGKCYCPEQSKHHGLNFTS